MRDILPKEEKYWQKIYHVTEDLAGYFRYGRIDTPILEATNLFARSIGRGTDVVDKEMYSFLDQDGSKICLRPEATASVARAYIAHGMWNYPQPVKLWYVGPMFRHDRPQAGRYRQFNQAGFEVLGAKDPAIDAELVLVAYNFYKDLGLPVTIHINSIGTLEERERYKTELLNYYRAKRAYLCEDCKKRMNRNPLRLLDCKEERCRVVEEEAPQITDWLGEESKNHFMKVLEYLDELEIPYVLRPTLVRGLDYYNYTVFEVYPSEGEELAQSALGGGGRYDGLIKLMGGPETPAAGFALGIERSIEYWRRYQEQKGIAEKPLNPHAFFAHLGDEGRKETLKLVSDLRGSGLQVGFNFSKSSLKSQLDLANSQHAPLVLIIGQKEVQDKTVIVRDMESGEQEIVDQKKAEKLLKKKLGLV